MNYLLSSVGTVVFGLSVFSSGLFAADVPLSERGLPLISPDGVPLNYTEQFLDSKPYRNKAAHEPARTSAAPSTPLWHYGSWGTNLGHRGLVTTGRGKKQRLWMARSASGGFGSPDSWIVLRWINGSFNQVAPGEIYNSPIASMVGYPSVNPNYVVVALENGKILVYHAATYESAATLSFISRVAGLSDMICYDVDGNGIDELVVTGADETKVFSIGGELIARFPYGGTTLAAGLLYKDPDAEIVISGGSGGYVLDSRSGNVQWYRPEGFGTKIVVANTDSDETLEIIGSEGWYEVNGYDPSRKVKSFTISTDIDIDAMVLGDIDGDHLPELLIGDGQWGSIHAYDLRKRTAVWNIQNPEHGVTNIAMIDLSHDGAPEIVWGAGASSTGADYLYVADVASKKVLWQNPSLDGPFIGPELGDVDGDGKPELLICSSYSESEYGSGRILVFDPTTHVLKGMSPQISKGNCWEGVRDLKLRDLTGDGVLEILVAGDWLYDGYIEAFSFQNSRFKRIWSNAERPSGSPFSCVEAIDVDGDGIVEIIAGNAVAHTGSDGNYVRAFSLKTGKQKWMTPSLGSDFWGSVSDIVIGSFDSAAKIQVVAVIDGGPAYIIDAKNGRLSQEISGNFVTLCKAGSSEMYLADSSGLISRLRAQTSKWSFTKTWNPRIGRIESISSFTPRELLVCGGGALTSLNLKTGKMMIIGAFGAEGPKGVVYSRTTNSFFTTTKIGVDEYAQ